MYRVLIKPSSDYKVGGGNRIVRGVSYGSEVCCIMKVYSIGFWKNVEAWNSGISLQMLFLKIDHTMYNLISSTNCSLPLLISILLPSNYYTQPLIYLPPSHSFPCLYPGLLLLFGFHELLAEELGAPVLTSNDNGKPSSKYMGTPSYSGCW